MRARKDLTSFDTPSSQPGPFPIAFAAFHLLHGILPFRPDHIENVTMYASSGISIHGHWTGVIVSPTQTPRIVFFREIPFNYHIFAAKFHPPQNYWSNSWVGVCGKISSFNKKRSIQSWMDPFRGTHVGDSGFSRLPRFSEDVFLLPEGPKFFAKRANRILIKQKSWKQKLKNRDLGRNHNFNLRSLRSVSP